jgi:valyl-tRNA synthetase
MARPTSRWPRRGPETLLGDVAVAVHPGGSALQGLDACVVELPILKRRSEVIRDAYVDPALARAL